MELVWGLRGWKQQERTGKQLSGQGAQGVVSLCSVWAPAKNGYLWITFETLFWIDLQRWRDLSSTCV